MFGPRRKGDTLASIRHMVCGIWPEDDGEGCRLPRKRSSEAAQTTEKTVRQRSLLAPVRCLDGGSGRNPSL